MALRPCLDCGALSTGPRCPVHQRVRDRVALAGKRARRPYTSGERDRRAQAVRAWRQVYGDWCPGYQRAGHPARDLTADHLIPVGAGGSEAGPLGVLCTACNGRKSVRVA